MELVRIETSEAAQLSSAKGLLLEATLTTTCITYRFMKKLLNCIVGKVDKRYCKGIRMCGTKTLPTVLYHFMLGYNFTQLYKAAIELSEPTILY